jgi:hypothetical protein
VLPSGSGSTSTTADSSCAALYALAIADGASTRRPSRAAAGRLRRPITGSPASMPVLKRSNAEAAVGAADEAAGFHHGAHQVTPGQLNCAVEPAGRGTTVSLVGQQQRVAAARGDAAVADVAHREDHFRRGRLGRRHRQVRGEAHDDPLQAGRGAAQDVGRVFNVQVLLRERRAQGRVDHPPGVTLAPIRSQRVRPRVDARRAA